MIRRVALLTAIGIGLGLGATAVAQEGGDDELDIDMTRGCLNGTRVTVKITPPDDAILSPVHIRTSRGEAVHLTGVTQAASVTVRIPRRGRVTVSGETTAGDRFTMSRSYRACAPEPTTTPRARPRPSPPRVISGGGEG
ncbi:MAG TPA: hypothetical protein VFZ00_17790 [Solirubrobacter sp.]|nr:hypothetical protein [Solirubrobacter sp.]